MESEYDFESSEFSIGENRNNVDKGSRTIGIDNSARKRLFSKIEKIQLTFLKSEKGKRHYQYFKALIEYLNLVDKLQNLFDQSSHKTLLYLLTLLVNRIESWNSTILGALKKNKKYFLSGNDFY